MGETKMEKGVAKSFGRGKRLGIAAMVTLNVLAAVAVWLLLNYVLTRPQLRTTLDFSRNARFSISPETKAMIAELREREQKIKIDTYYLSAKDGRLRGIAGIQQRVLELTRDLMRRLAYYGGDQLELVDHNVYGAITSKRAQEMGLEQGSENSVKLTIGQRERKLDLLRDLADIEVPEAQQSRPGQIAVPVLRDYKGEEAVASAIRSLMQEDDLVAYWPNNYFNAGPQDRTGSGANLLAREMTSQGFENKTFDLKTTQRVPDDCKLLVLLGPEMPLSRRETDVVLDWLKGGGRALITTNYPADGSSALTLQLFKRVGIRLGSSWLFNGVADPNVPGNFRIGSAECARVIVDGLGLSATHPVTERLRQIKVPVELHRARPLEIGSLPEGVTATTFLSTNPKSWETVVPEGSTRPNLGMPPADQVGPRHVGVSVEFAPAEKGGRKGRLVVLSGMAFRNGGDSFLGQYAGSLFRSNQAFAAYLVNWLVRAQSLVSVQTHRSRTRTMTVSEPQIDRVRFAFVWVLPLVFLVLSFFVVFWRRRA